MLNGLTDLLSQAEAALADVPRPIVLSGWPVNGDTKEEVITIGLTPEEIKQASLGKRTGIINKRGSYVSYYHIIRCEYFNDEECSIVFASYDYEEQTFDNFIECVVAFTGGEVYISNYSI